MGSAELFAGHAPSWRSRGAVFLTALFMLLAIMPAAVRAEAPSYGRPPAVGAFAKMEGRVDVLHDQARSASAVKVGDAVYLGDIIRTKTGGRAEVVFKDQSVMSIASGSRLKIDKYVLNNDNTRKKAEVSLFRGKVRAAVTKAREEVMPVSSIEGSTFNINTPTAVAGARGTELFVFFTNGVTGVVFTEGHGFVYNANAPGQVVNVSAGLATLITSHDALPARPRLASDKEVRQHIRDTTITKVSGNVDNGGKGGATDEVFGYTEPTTDGHGPALPEGPASHGDMIGVVALTDFAPELLGDTTAPVVTLTSAPASVTNQNTATFVITLDEPATLTYSVNNVIIKSGPVTTQDTLDLTGLPEGRYALDVTAVDAAGNTSTPITYSWFYGARQYDMTGGAVDTTGASTLSVASTGNLNLISTGTQGAWQLNLNGTYTGAPSTSVVAGGTATDGALAFNGYWIDKLNLAAGTSSLAYLSTTVYGTGAGTVTGGYDGAGGFSAMDIGRGTYTKTPLAWSGNIANDGYSGSLYYNDGLNGSGWPWRGGTSTGLMGGIASPWRGTTAASYIGKYAGFAAGPPYLWAPDVYSYNSNNATYSTFDGGKYRGFVGGVWKADATIDANVYSLYIDPSGNAGILKGSLAGNYYPGINMFEATGTWTPAVITTGRNATVATFYSMSYPFGSNASLGDFSGTGSIRVVGTRDFSANGWRYFIDDKGWGILKSTFGGVYTGTPSDTWSLNGEVTGMVTGYSTMTEGTKWSADASGNNVIKGRTYVYGADLFSADLVSVTPNTWISVGETLGSFDPVAQTWQVVQTSAWLETSKFLAMADPLDPAYNPAALTSLNIPFVEVGKANLAGSAAMGNGSVNVNMNNVTFFAYSSGAAPKIWATGDVSGGYTCTACGAANVALAGNGLNASFNIKTFETTVISTVTKKWIATVNGNGTYSGTGTMNGSNVQMTGAAAGTINTGTNTFAGTAAGTAQ